MTNEPGIAAGSESLGKGMRGPALDTSCTSLSNDAEAISNNNAADERITRRLGPMPDPHSDADDNMAAVFADKALLRKGMLRTLRALTEEQLAEQCESPSLLYPGNS